MTHPSTSASQRFIPAFIERIRIRDLGPIVDRELRLERGITLLLGDNNVGKSTVLRAIQLALGSVRSERADIRCREEDGRPTPQPCAVIDIGIELAGNPDDDSLAEPERDALERASNIFRTGLEPGEPPKVFVRTVIAASPSGESEGTIIERIFLPGWLELPATSTSIDMYTKDSKGRVDTALASLFECFNLDATRDLATESQQRRSNWGRVVADADYSGASKLEIEKQIKTLGQTVKQNSTRLAVAEMHVGKLSRHFKSSVREVALHSINPDPDGLVRDTEVTFATPLGRACRCGCKAQASGALRQ